MLHIGEGLMFLGVLVLLYCCYRAGLSAGIDRGIREEQKFREENMKRYHTKP